MVIVITEIPNVVLMPEIVENLRRVPNKETIVYQVSIRVKPGHVIICVYSQPMRLSALFCFQTTQLLSSKLIELIVTTTKRK